MSPTVWVGWLLALLGAGGVAWVVGRPPAGLSDHGVQHALYVLVYVLVPGTVILRAWWGRPLRWSEVAAVGLPLGIVAEALFYSTLTAGGVKAWYLAAPVGWLLLGWLARRRLSSGGWLRAPGWGSGPAAAVFAGMGVVVALGAAGLHSIAVRLEDGMLAAPTHHDWVYLSARGQEIMTQGRWEDPSLAGVGLSYHFLLLVHAAAAATVTGEEIDTVLFRTVLLPLGAALLAQVYWAGRRVTRQRAGGMIAMVLLFLPAAKWTRTQEGGAFMDFFDLWLFVSPTFFLGLVFFGALMIGIFVAVARPAEWRKHAGGLLLLAAGGALAKATVVPALAVAVTLWALAGPIRRPLGRRCLTMVGAAAVLTAGWWGVYALILSDWGSGALQWSPGGTLAAMPFGRDNLVGWASSLEAVLPQGWAKSASTWAVGIVAFFALSGIRAAALLLLLRRWAVHAPLAAWVTWCAVASIGWGVLVTMDSHGQLYFLLPARIPMAILGAAGLCALAVRIKRWATRTDLLRPRWVGLMYAGSCAAMVAAVLAVAGLAPWMWGGAAALILLLWPRQIPPAAESQSGSTCGGDERTVMRLAASVALLFILVGAGLVQARLMWIKQEMNVLRWWRGEQISYAPTLPLHAAMVWAREHTPRNAVFVADAFTSQHLRRATSPVVLDLTSIDKHYYYTAWAARRFWLEGPTYIQRREEIAPRLAAADALFERGVLPKVGARPVFVLIDRALPGGGARARAEWGEPVFANEQAEIYAVTRGLAPGNPPPLAAINHQRN